MVHLPPRLQDNLLHNSGNLPKISPPVPTDEQKRLFSFPKVELHLHLDGSPRWQTILDIAEKRGMSAGGAKTEEELRKLVVTHEPADLGRVLEAFSVFLPIIRGSAEALERIAYETCEDQAASGVVYFEARYNAQLLASDDLTPLGVVEAVHRGLERGRLDFGVDSRQILCCIRGLEQYDEQVVQLIESCKHLGVVGIDVAGSASGADEQYQESVKRAFRMAKTLGIHRTVHAGESGTDKEVLIAVNEMSAERIGHGYRILRSEQSYKEYFVPGPTQKHNLHLEACPYSSVMTGSVPLDWNNHPIARWAMDEVSFSLSRDDPTCFGNSPLSELALANSSIGLSVHQLWKCQLNAAEHCFLEADKKADLIERIKAAEPPQNS